MAHQCCEAALLRALESSLSSGLAGGEKKEAERGSQKTSGAQLHWLSHYYSYSFHPHSLSFSISGGHLYRDITAFNYSW